VQEDETYLSLGDDADTLAAGQSPAGRPGLLVTSLHSVKQDVTARPRPQLGRDRPDRPPGLDRRGHAAG
jgi:hypothetical protein